jgi:hypothetical protein
MWVVKRCVRDYGDVIRIAVAEFETSQAAWEYADEADDSNPWKDTWYEVKEE